MNNNNNNNNNGVVRLPPGFRFHPTDEELVVQYLKRKVHSFPLPASIIPEIHVCNSDPWDLPGDLQQDRFFFSSKQVKYPNGNRSNRSTLSGYWKATGLDKQIVKQKQVVGIKKTLVFYKGKPPTGHRTDWIMHEYRLAPEPNNTSHSQGMEKWVVCRIFLKKRGNKKEQEEEVANNNNNNNNNVEQKDKSNPIIFYDFMATTTTTRTSKRKKDLPLLSSGSSGITCEEEEEQSSSDDVSTFSSRVAKLMFRNNSPI